MGIALIILSYLTSSTAELKEIRTEAYKTTKANESGKKTFHPKRISWSYLYLGKVPRTTTNNTMKNKTLTANQMYEGTKLNGKKLNTGDHPPRKSSAEADDIRIILLYSARKKSAKPIAEYSTL
jgi:hypothetical protein